MLLGVNIDHVATLRNARGVSYPSPVEAAAIAQTHGADLITLHLREDRRHIRDSDIFAVKEVCRTRLNLEMAMTQEMLSIAEDLAPEDVCLVPEKREELSTEGGLEVVKQQKKVQIFTEQLHALGIRVSIFIDPDLAQIQAAYDIGATVIELHTGAYANACTPEQQIQELERIRTAAYFAQELGMTVNAGHGLTIHNVAPIAQILPIVELNIGHALIAQAIFLGLPAAIEQMKTLMYRARSQVNS